jgi:hypothetical protein
MSFSVVFSCKCGLELFDYENGATQCCILYTATSHQVGELSFPILYYSLNIHKPSIVHPKREAQLRKTAYCFTRPLPFQCLISTYISLGTWRVNDEKKYGIKLNGFKPPFRLRRSWFSNPSSQPTPETQL